MSAARSLDSLVLEILRTSPEPLGADQLVDRLPAAAVQEIGPKRQKLRAVLQRCPEIGHASRGRYVYLPHRIAGSRFRVPLTGVETEGGPIWPGPELFAALWYRIAAERWVRTEQLAALATECLLPDGTRAALRAAEVVRRRGKYRGRICRLEAGQELRDWLRSEGATAGDSLLVRVTDPEKPECELELERLSERDAALQERNRGLLESARDVLELERRGLTLSEHDLATWLISRGFYQGECPPDPLLVLLATDPGFTVDREDKIALATKWDRLVVEEDYLFGMPVTGLLEGLELSQIGHLGGKQSEEAAPEVPLSPDQQRQLWGVEPLEELGPWLQAAGYVFDEDREPAQAQVAAEVEARRAHTYRLHVADGRRAGRSVKAKGTERLSDLDRVLRRRFEDSDDHMSGFFVRTAGSTRPVALATYNPFGGVEEGADYELAELDLEPEDQILYVFDFGGWIQQLITVEAVETPGDKKARATGKSSAAEPAQGGPFEPTSTRRKPGGLE